MQLGADLLHHEDGDHHRQGEQRGHAERHAHACVLPPDEVLRGEHNALLALEGAHLEVALDVELDRVALLELLALQPAVELAEPRDARQPHPHDEVLVHHAAAVVV